MKRHARVLHDAIKYSSVHVELEGANACQRCAGGHGCGHGVIDQNAGRCLLTCYTNEAVKSDQRVLVEFDDQGSAWLWLVAGAYGIPLLGLLGASLLTWLWIHNTVALQVDAVGLVVNSDVPVALAGLFGLTGGLIAWRVISPMVFRKLQPGLCLQSARIVTNRSSSK